MRWIKAANNVLAYIVLSSLGYRGTVYGFNLCSDRRSQLVFKDVLLALTTYPEATLVSAIDEAVMLAAALGARISAIACEVKVQVPGSILANAFEIPAMVAAQARKSSSNAHSLLAAFESAAEKCGIFQERILEQCLTSAVPDLFVDYAQLRDLTIIPVPEGDYNIVTNGTPSRSYLAPDGRP